MLEQALGDIRAQTYSDLEIVLVDDGDSPSQVGTVVKAAADQRIRVVDRTGNTPGRAAAANSGIMAARGDLLVLHDDDDAWKPEFLDRTVAYLDEHPESMAVSARTEVVIHHVDEAGDEIDEDRGPLNPGLEAITVSDMLRVNRVAPISLLYRARLHDEIGYIDESLSVLEDWDFYLRLLMHHPIALLGAPELAEWHHRPGGTGDEGNSVYVLKDEHEAANERLRDRYLRGAMKEHGPGIGMLVVSEVHRLEQMLAAEREAHRRSADDARRQIDEVSRQLAEISRRLEEVPRHIDSVRHLVTERTSVTSLLRRLRRRDR